MLFFYFYNSGWERWPFRIEISSFCKRNYLTQALLSNPWAFFFLCSNDWKFYKLVFLLNPRNIFFFLWLLLSILFWSVGLFLPLNYWFNIFFCWNFLWKIGYRMSLPIWHLYSHHTKIPTSNVPAGMFRRELLSYS